MGNNCWGLGIICTCLMMMAHKCVSVGNLTCSEQERPSLLKFKDSVKDVNGMLSSWDGNDCCKWERVSCEDATGKVVGLHLRSNAWDDPLIVFEDGGFFYGDMISIGVDEVHYLVGDELNSCLAELVNLRHLDLSWNNFQNSRIPEFIGSLRQLRYLNLSHAGFDGNIPHQIGNLSNLKVLDLSNTDIIGNIPHEIGNLSNLEVLDISYSQDLMTNDLKWISHLSKLKQLDLSWVDLSRVQNLGSLLYTNPSLLMLCLSECGLSMASLGSRHFNSTGEVARIKHLDLSTNNFQCQLPSLFQNMTSLTFLDLSSSYLRTSRSFENLLNMIPLVSELHLSWCNLQKINLSPINFNFCQHSSIQHLDLSYNVIEGRFPSILANMSSLLSLDLTSNSLNSSIPIMPNLLKLDISANNFTHIDDVGIWRQCHLKELICSSNNLEGEMTSPSTNVSECSQIELEILNLSFNMLTSSIPESLLRFTNLKGLELWSNDLTGPVPKALGKLRSLQRLDLSYNHLSGLIPESLGRLTALTGIYLESNRFTGPIPTSLGRLTSLRVFSMASNLLNGTIPKSVGQLTKLNVFDVSNNYLQGAISDEHFANLSMLKYLDASYNKNLFFNISSEWIPPFQLKVVRLRSCKFKDGFPQWFQTQRKLMELVMSNASLSGALPTWLRLMPNICLLDLSHNQLTGPLTNLPLMSYLPIYDFTYEQYSGGILLLQSNLFKGLIPKWLCRNTDLQVLDISRNRLTGKIPKCLWDLSLEIMILGSNKLSGVIPSYYGYSHLKWLQLNDNNFNGELPQDSGYFNNLIVLDLGENKISGIIPEWIGKNISSLYALRLRNNNFTGRIPHSLCKCKELRILDLAHNLTGYVPHCIGELNGMKTELWGYFQMDHYGYGNMLQVLKGVALDYTKNLQFVINMDLSSNNLVGEVPEALTRLEGLIGLNLSNNHISGRIPTNIGNLKSLNSLDLSANELTGAIPQSMKTLNFLSYLNLSRNNLSGPIPTGNQLQTLTDPSIYAVNPYLCGAPLLKKCSPHESPPITRSKNKGKNVNEPKKVLIYLDITCGFITGFWGIIGVLFWKKQWRHQLFMFSEKAMDKIYVVVAVRVLRMKRGREAA